jgi:hypothetical protein
MKNTLIISLLCIFSVAANAQYKYTTNDNPPLVNNGKAIPVTPAFSVPYKVMSNPACYMYKKHGLVVLECPGVWFEPEKEVVQSAARRNGWQTNGNMNVEYESNYTGRYPQNLKPDPEMPANAVPVWPESSATPTLNPPCYKYKTKKGLEVMECHGLLFPPKEDDK